MLSDWCLIPDLLQGQCLSPLKSWFRIPHMVKCTLCDKVCHWLATGLWFSPGTPVCSINKIDHHDITDILLKVALNTITLTIHQVTFWWDNYNVSFVLDQSPQFDFYIAGSLKKNQSTGKHVAPLRFII
jgi:hypothetical protein